MSLRRMRDFLVTRESSEPLPPIPQAVSPLSVLVVDDDIVTLGIASRLCERVGCRVTLGGSFSDAQRGLTQDRPQVCLIDQHLDNGIRGSDVIEWAHGERLTTEFIVMTSSDRRDDVVMALRAGAFDFVDKPITPLVLSRALVRIADALESRGAKAALARQWAEADVPPRHPGGPGENGLAQEILGALPFGLLVLDRDGAIRSSSPVACRILGCTEAELASRRLGHDPWLQRLDDVVAELAGGPAGHGSRNVCLARPGAGGHSEALWVDLHVTALPRGPEDGARTLVLLSEIPAGRLVEGRIAQEDRQALVGLLATQVATALADPVMVLLGTLETLHARLPADAGVHEELARLEAGARRCLTLMQTVEDAARPTWEEPAEVDVNAVIRSALEPWLPRLQVCGIAVSQELAPGPACIRAPRRELEHLIWLLLRAASERVASAPITILTSQAQGRVTVLISSPAAGAPFDVPAALASDPASALARSTPASLELAVCRQIVRRWGGELRFIVTGERGGFIRIGLPAACAVRAA